MTERSYDRLCSFLRGCGYALWIPLLPLLLLVLPGAILYSLADKLTWQRNGEYGLFAWLVPLNKRSSQRWCLKCNKQIPSKYAFCGPVCEKLWKDAHPEENHNGHWTIPNNTQLWCIR